ncbi:MAG TPA: Clp protease ClpP [Epulopiscium sp.]|nr:Clp protease ClpP [Candidatus Epulonipiscium sp.]
MKKYYSLYQNAENKTADIYIYGDITSWPWYEDEVSSYTLAKELQSLGEDIENINIYINSYGGEVKEGLAIYNALKRSNAKITTYADGFACSIASVIFSAGDERKMSNTSLLMIHNAWTYTSGNASELKKQAEDLEIITQASINAYMNNVNITEEEVKEMMDDETWISGEDAVKMGFATKLIEVDEKEVATQSIRNSLFQKVTKEPEKSIVTKMDFSKEDLENVIQEQIKRLIDKLPKESEKQQDNDAKNKPLSMMAALLNYMEDK